ncbi:hypothetical protein DFP74_0631 [Nocardiopsis sp. Huas11]|nr:hypothetical protein [Nocardiopsis sp. Huas11]RKS05043.1 hypothetical protein DFP74_0631 [Nocardiopsis sp. Huas11]
MSSTPTNAPADGNSSAEASITYDYDDLNNMVGTQLVLDRQERHAALGHMAGDGSVELVDVAEDVAAAVEEDRCGSSDRAVLRTSRP